MFTTGVSEAGVTLDRLALEGTKQIRPDVVGLLQSVEAHFASGGQSSGRDRLRRERNLGGDHPTNV